MLTTSDIRSIISSGEGFNAEFKVSLPANLKGIAEEVCAFANAAGGTLLVGVDDHGLILGTAIDNNKRSNLQSSLNAISPKLQYEFYMVAVDGKEVWVLDVPSGPGKPYVLSGAIYVRQGSSSQKLVTAEEMRDFFQQANKIYFDEAACMEVDLATDIPIENIAVFRSEANLNTGISNEQVFNNLKLITEDGFLKNGAVLFFAKDPDRFFEKAVIRCIAFEGVDKRLIVDDKIMTGTLYQQFLKSISWLYSKLNVRYDIEGAGSGPREELWEIPETVFKEAIINSLAHRDYYDKGGRITIELFDDRVEIANPGGLLSAIPKNEFGKRSLSRNPLIFGLFERMRMVEHIGSGIARMRDLMRDEGLTPPEFSMDGMFTVTLRRPFDFDKWVNGWVDTLTENRIKIIKEIHLNTKVSKKVLEEKIGIGATAIDNNLDYLKDLGIIAREGGAKGGVWKINYISH